MTEPFALHFLEKGTSSWFWIPEDISYFKTIPSYHPLVIIPHVPVIVIIQKWAKLEK